MFSPLLRGLGISYAAAFLFEADIAGGAVQALMTDWRAVDTPIHLVSPPARRDSAKVMAFADFASARLAPRPV